MTAAIMFQGTGSDVGKSLIVTGLARLFARQGLVVRPFKPQNMSNNAAPAIAPDGFYGEIGRAQALQARAAGLDPTTDMNPVLLKPQTDIGAQVIVDGRVIGNAEARAYHAMKPDLLPPVLAAFDRLSEGADLILVEGAGSPAEVNLRAGDIANMGFAEAADIPVVLIGDIERGGVIASLVGTHALLTPGEQARLAGYIINRFRGDVSLFDDALPLSDREPGSIHWALFHGSTVPVHCPPKTLPLWRTVTPGRTGRQQKSASPCPGFPGLPILTIWTRWPPNPASRSGSFTPAKNCQRMRISFCWRAQNPHAAISTIYDTTVGLRTFRPLPNAARISWGSAVDTRCSGGLWQIPTGSRVAPGQPKASVCSTSKQPSPKRKRSPPHPVTP